MLTYLIGIYESEDGPKSSIISFDTELSPEDAKAAVKQTAVEYLEALADEEGFRMPHDYGFGDIVELSYNRSFARMLHRRGVDLVSPPPFAAIEFDYDAIWIRTEEVHGDGETLMFKQDDKLRVELAYIGEGLSGDYDPDADYDIPLVRFYVTAKRDGAWEDVEDGSYCTNIPVTSSRKHLRECLEKLFSEYAQVVDSYLAGQSVKKLGERLSWMS